MLCNVLTGGERRLFPASFAREMLRFLIALMLIFVPLLVGRVVQKAYAFDSDLQRGLATLVQVNVPFCVAEHFSLNAQLWSFLLNVLCGSLSGCGQ